jgi:hypothetical protein
MVPIIAKNFENDGEPRGFMELILKQLWKV